MHGKNSIFLKGKDYVLAEEDKYALLKSLEKEFGVKWYHEINSKSDIPQRAQEIMSQINEDNLPILIKELSNLHFSTSGLGRLWITYKENHFQGRWNYLWVGGYPLLEFCEICIYSLKIPFAKSKTEKLAKKIHKKYASL